MKFCLSRYRKALVLLAMLVPSFCFAETLTEYTSTCETALEIPQGSITEFNCSTGMLLPTTAFGTACDAQALLPTVGCAANSRLGLQSYSNPNVKAVWVCRKYDGFDNPTDQRYHDIAMIVHNRQNGKTCFFQNNLDNTSDGPTVPSPKASGASAVWKTPQQTAAIPCASCHVNDAFIVTPHVAFAMRFHNMVRFNPKGPYSAVGTDFNHFNTQQISRVDGCGGLCHFDNANFSGDAITKQWMAPDARPDYMNYHFKPVPGQFYSLGSTGEIRGFNGLDGGTCNGNSCSHWSLLDSNPSTTSTAGSNGQFYQLHSSGQIFRFKGVQCRSIGDCPSWESIYGSNSKTAQITSGGGFVYQRWNTGPIFVYTNSSWQPLDNNPATVEIVASGSFLYQRHSNGNVWRYTGTPCSTTSCPGWQLIANDPTTIRLITDSSTSVETLYIQQQSGTLFKYTGTPCNGSVCAGFQQVDSANSNTKQVVAGGGKLYRLHNNGQIWRYTGSGQTWTMIGNNPITREIVASAGGLLQRHSDGVVWRFTGTVCSGSTCNGWTPIENVPNTVSLTGARQ